MPEKQPVSLQEQYKRYSLKETLCKANALAFLLWFAAETTTQTLPSTNLAFYVLVTAGAFISATAASVYAIHGFKTKLKMN